MAFYVIDYCFIERCSICTKYRPMSKNREDHLVDPPALYSQPVLVHRDDLAVLQDGLVLGPDGPEVHGHEERSGENGPHGHLGLALFVAQAKVANDQLQTRHTHTDVHDDINPHVDIIETPVDMYRSMITISGSFQWPGPALGMMVSWLSP